MTLEARRIVEIWSPGTQKVGTGYLVDGGHVLTAAHLLPEADEPFDVRPLGERDWVTASICWRGSAACDAALLRLEGRDLGARAPVRLGWLAGDERVDCRAAGFPEIQHRADGARDVRDTEELVGELAPLSGRKSGRLTLHVPGGLPRPEGLTGSPWSGMSGAAVFAAPRADHPDWAIVGVVGWDADFVDSNRLLVVPVAAMAAEAGFADAWPAQPELTAVEALGVLREPYLPLPPQLSPAALRGGATAFLLLADYGSVPFRGREQEQEDLRRWCDGPPELSVRLCLGAGGTGKTRLAAELSREQRKTGAIAGFLEPGAGLEAVERLARARAPLLVVVDEAQSRVDEIAQILGALGRTQREDSTRVLLVARQRGDWWESGLQDRLPDGGAARLALATGKVIELGPVETTADGREQAFRDAVETFAATMGRPVGALQVPDLDQPLFDGMLFVQLAALTALEGEDDILRRRVLAADLLDYALRREARYWASMARSRELAASPQILQRAVAVATLTTAAGEEEAARALRAVPDLADAPERERRDIARWLRELYPAATAGWFGPLAPDPLGEALVATVLAEDAAPSIADALLAAATREQATRTLTVLTHAAREHETAERALRAGLAAEPERRWPMAVEVAQQAGDPIGTILAATMEAVARPELAAELVATLPAHTTALREVAVVATRQGLEHAIADDDPGSFARAGAMALELSSRLAHLGRFHEALDVTQRTVDTLREWNRESEGAFSAGLATALDNLGVIVAELGRLDRAMELCEEGLALRRELVAGDPDYGAVLALSLVNHANRLGEQGRPEDALASIEEAVELYRRPTPILDRDTRVANLALALNNRAVILNGLGRYEAALESAEESAGHYQGLADARPDAFLPDLVTALTSVAATRRLLGRSGTLPATEQAVRIHRQLAETRPDAFLAQLAGSLMTLTADLSAVGRDEEALDRLAEAIVIYERLSDLRDDAPLPALGGALAYACTMLRTLGQNERAVESGEEAIAILRPLADERPDVHGPALADALSNLAIALGTLDRPDEALTAAEQAVEIYRRLAAVRPEAFEDSLAHALDALAIALADIGRPEAVAASQEAGELWRRLAGDRPEAHLHDLAQSLVVLSGALTEQKRWDDALTPVHEAIALLEELVVGRPMKYLGMLGLARSGLATVLAELGSVDDAAAEAERAVVCLRQLAEVRSGVVVLRLLAALDLHADLLKRLGRFDEAAAVEAEAASIRSSFETAVSVSEPESTPAPEQPVRIAPTISTLRPVRRPPVRRRLSFAEHIRQLCRARYPFAYVQTWEEERVIEELRGVAAALDPPRKVIAWGRVDGLRAEGDAAIKGTDSPLGALVEIESYAEPAVFVLKDFHTAIDKRPGRESTEQVIRKMRDIAAASKRDAPKLVVIVAPSLVLPDELQKDVTLVEFDLPTQSEIRDVLDRLMERNRNSARIVIDLDHEAQELLVEAALGLTLREVEHAFARAMVDDNRLDASDVKVVLEEKRQIISRSRILEFLPSSDDFEDIGGLENLKHWLLKRNGSWLEAARDYGLKPPKGLLITGVPGCGKSLTAKCTSAVWGLPLLRLDVGRVFGNLLGDSEERMRTALRTAEAIAPSILFIDEVEKGFAGAGGGSLDGGTSTRVFGSFLTWMQEKEAAVFVIATANNLTGLPPEFLRKGRFDEIFFVDLPTAAERTRIFEIHLGRRLESPAVAGAFTLTPELIEQLVALTDGYSGAEIEEIVTTAVFDAFADRRGLELSDLRRAIRNSVPLSITQAERIDEARRWAAERAVPATPRDVRVEAASRPGVATGVADGNGGREIQF